MLSAHKSTTLSGFLTRLPLRLVRVFLRYLFPDVVEGILYIDIELVGKPAQREIEVAYAVDEDVLLFSGDLFPFLRVLVAQVLAHLYQLLMKVVELVYVWSVFPAVVLGESFHEGLGILHGFDAFHEEPIYPKRKKPDDAAPERR